ncbi:hypothetical protein PLESTB_001397300 [Pleodorina starrii]|uniref:Origin recognition complex subunit 2 n=1 Tax=Pleodorina starrii TaxID=330485 RepID=A0A9W6F734_9CHLO|nr:hypothetical protein PLESTM_000535000 [Pleodorina starrii]GLC58754.1 hypothetical protein PLESTB_001397300 [Pleodorina starrii]GLC75161.1 hypothetical protein PLESTF_001601800 [Pleodorina starrii]
MAPRKASQVAATDGSAPGPSQRTTRAAASKMAVAIEISGSEAVPSNAAGSGRSSQQTAAAAPDRSGAPPPRVTRGRTQAAAPAGKGAEDDSSSSGHASGSDSDVQEVDPSEVRKQEEGHGGPQSTRAMRPRPAAAHTAAKAAAAAPPPPPPSSSIQLRGRAGSGRVAAKATGAAAPASGTAVAAAAPRDTRRRQGAAPPAPAPAPPQAQARAEGSGDDDDDGRSDDSDGDDEEEEEEEGRPVAARGTGGATASGRGRGRGNPPLVPPTAVESRKRLFELLERRVGGAAGDGAGGRRTQYGDLPAKNPNKKAKLLVDLKSQFDDWHSRLRSNFSVLLYGFGSKRGLLDDFARTLAGPRNRGDAAVLVFHGYNPRCTAKEVVAGVAGALLQRTFRNLGGGGGGGGGAGGAAAAAAAPAAAVTATGGGGAPAAVRALVEDIRCEPVDRHAFVVIHNIDGPGLRGDVSLLSALAACPQVHVIASIDHALAPLLWDSADAARFRWQYMNATTFAPYAAEVSGAQSVLGGAFKSGVVTAGAGTVLRSLVLGAQEVFKLLAEHLMEDEECEGVAFAHLYRMCRERFLVRDERVLRQHLVEFVDHQLVKLRPASDNSGELLTIPMAPADMRAVLDDLAAARGE